MARFVNFFMDDDEDEHFIHRPHRIITDRPDCFQTLSDSEFIDNFRLTKQLALQLIEELQPFIKPERRNTDLSPKTKVLTALRFYAQGSYQLSIGNDSNLGICQKSVCNCLHEVTEAIVDNLAAQWITFPSDDELVDVRARFFNKFGMRGVVGCIDCTHIAIVAPSKKDNEYREELFVNRKGFHSINTQLVCDSQGIIINVNANFPGSTHDSFIWNSCILRQHLVEKYNSGSFSSFLLGDSGYPLEPFLMTPMPGDYEEGSNEFRYNQLHKLTRTTIERVNGVLKSRFRCLMRHRTLHYHPSMAAKIIIACCVLHNMCKKAGIHDYERDDNLLDVNDELDVENENHAQQRVLDRRINRRVTFLELGRQKRRNIIDGL